MMGRTEGSNRLAVLLSGQTIASIRAYVDAFKRGIEKYPDFEWGGMDEILEDAPPHYMPIVEIVPLLLDIAEAAVGASRKAKREYDALCADMGDEPEPDECWAEVERLMVALARLEEK